MGAATAVRERPKRIQRKRSKGWRMPPNAVYVGRPTIFGNPWTHAETLASGIFKPEAVSAVNVAEYRGWLIAPAFKDARFEKYRELAERKREILRRLPELRGKDLACFCPLDRPCHADVLLEIANRVLPPSP